jgi:hypothetical protein
MKNAIKMFALACIAGLSFGCATVLDIADDACETALGGSKVGDSLCDKIDVLKSDE